MVSVWGELKRRKVVKVAVAYAVVGWMVIEVSATVLPVFEAPDWVLQVLTFFVILGFPAALILSWVYDITPEGVQRTGDASSENAPTSNGRKLDFAIIAALVLALGLVIYNYESAEMAEGEPGAVEASRNGGQEAVLPNSVAVLVFENLSPDPDNAYFAAGMHEEILNQLAKLRELSVISRTSVLRYEGSDLSIPEIADELNVETVMEGSVRYAGDRVRITAQLIDAQSDEHLWSEVYERDLSDVFAIQADIALSIANALEAEFSQAEQADLERIPTESEEAYQLFLRARALVETERPEALALLDLAIERDPDFAEAHAMKAYWSSISVIQTWGNAAVDPSERAGVEAIAQEAARRALELDPTDGSALVAIASIDRFYWRWDDAEARYRSAFNVSPNDPILLLDYAWFKSYQGDHATAIALIDRAVDLNPGWNSYYVQASILAHAGHVQEALAPARSALAVAPTNGISNIWLARILAILGQTDEAVERLRDVERILQGTALPVAVASIAYTYAHLGYPEDATRVIQELDAMSPDRDYDAGSWVFGYLADGDTEKAYESLQTVVDRIARKEPDASYYLLMIAKSNAFDDPVLDQPRFEELRRQITGF